MESRIIRELTRCVALAYARPVGAEHELVERIVAGDLEAWPALQIAVAPQIAAIARSHGELRAKGLAALPDDIAEIGIATVERLHRDNFANLRRFLEQEASTEGRAAQSFDSWLYGAVDFTIREHLRKRFGRAPKLDRADAQRPQPSKRDLGSQAGRLDAEVDRNFIRTLGMTTRLTAAELFAHVEAEFGAKDARAMRLYYVDDASFEEIAKALELASAKDAERMIRKLNARLRYKFVEQGP